MLSLREVGGGLSDRWMDDRGGLDAKVFFQGSMDIGLSLLSVLFLLLLLLFFFMRSRGMVFVHRKDIGSLYFSMEGRLRCDVQGDSSSLVMAGTHTHTVTHTVTHTESSR